MLGDLTAGAVARKLAENASATMRFRQRLLTNPVGMGQPSWVEDPEFDVARHLHRVRLPAPGTMNEVSAVGWAIAPATSFPGPCVVGGLGGAGLNDGRLVVVIKFAHAMSDGVGAVTALLPELMGADLEHQHRRAAEATLARMPAAPARVHDFVEEIASNTAAAVRIARRATPCGGGRNDGAPRGNRRRLPAAVLQQGISDPDASVPGPD